MRILVHVGWGGKVEFWNHDNAPQRPDVVNSGQTKDFLKLNNDKFYDKCENDKS